MQITVALEGAEPLRFECADNPVSRRVCEDILRGRTYPFLPFVDDVQVVFDVGANCGATPDCRRTRTAVVRRPRAQP